MPIDPQIPLMVRPPAPVDPMQIALQAQQYQLGRAQMQTLADERAATAQHTQIETAAAQRDYQEGTLLRQYFGNLQPGQDPDPQMVYRMVGPERGSKILDGLSALKTTQLKSEGAVRGMLGSVIGGLQALPASMQEESYNAVVQHLEQRGLLNASQVQPYSPAVLEMYRQQAMTPAEQTSAAETAAKLPGERAQSTIATAQAAGLKNGLTPEQQTTAAQQAANAAETARAHRASEAIERTKADIAQKTFQATYGSGLDANGNPLSPEALKAQALNDPQAQAIATYKIPPISPRMEADPKYKGLMARILAINPAYDATQFQTRQKARNEFTIGTQGQQLNAMNTAMLHLDLLSQAAESLKNGTFTPGNALYNKVATIFGGSAPTNYTQIKHYLDGEIGTLVKKGAVTDQEMRDEGATGASASSPEQIQGYLNNAIKIAASKAHALQYQAGQALGPQDPTVSGLLMPEVKGILQKHGFNPDGTPSASGGGGTFSITAPNGRTYRFNSQADLDAFKKNAGIQ